MMNYANMIEEKNLKKTFIIATLISTIIGTFMTGINLYERVEQKRKQKKTDLSQDEKIKRLEQQVNETQEKQKNAQNNDRRGVREDDAERSLREGGPMIRREYDRDMRRFGERFAIGDAITQNQLQGQIITLQSTVIALLEDALYTGRIADLNKLYNASELAREGSISALQQQYQRMLQAAPLRRPPGMQMRRSSSTPTLKSLAAARSEKKSVANGATRGDRNVDTRTQESDDSSTEASIATGRNAGRQAIDPDGPLFCPYGLDLQRAPRQPLAPSFTARSADMTCPFCRARLAAVAPGRAWKIVKETLHDLVQAPDHVEEVVEEHTFLLANRFVIKCHRPRPAAGFACVLCSRNRDSDTICESVEGLVRHVWLKHSTEEYRSDIDISEVSKEYTETKGRFR